MIDGPDREFLLSVFLMEAWDAVSALEDALPRLDEDAELDRARLVTHRLRGAAAVHGFPALSGLAATMEALVEAAAQDAPDLRPTTGARLTELVPLLTAVLDTIATTGEEGGAAVAIPEAAPRTGQDRPPGAAEDPRAAALARFFAGNADVMEYFGVEAAEHLEAMAAAVLALDGPGSGEAERTALFRAVHTLKGAAYTVGCRPMGDLAHRIEDLLAAVREGAVALTPAAGEAVLAGVDALRLMLHAAEQPQPDLAAAIDRAESLLAAASAVMAGSPHTGEEPQPAGTRALPAPAAEAPPAPHRDAGAGGGAAGEQMGGASAPVADGRAETARPAGRASIRVGLDRLDALMNLVGELVSARTRLEARLGQLDHLGEALRFTQRRMARIVGDFERKYLDPRLPSEAPRVAPADAALPSAVFEDLEFDRYDDFNILARSVGELSTDVAEIQTQLGALVRGVRGEAADIQRLTGELRGQVTRARLVPIGRLFARFQRQVREAARLGGTAVTLEVAGEQVALDNAIVEQIADPLLHLLQNAVVHGIEPPGERRRLGKPETGRVRLTAVQRGGAVRLEVEDDGRGIDAEALAHTARARGLLPAEALAALSPRQRLDLVFLPGLSTAAAVTAAAGRGVGMDVVRTNVTRLGGTIDVETRPGAGTRFTLELPLTVAITDAFLVRVGPEVIAVPVAAVRTVVPLRRDDVEATPRGPAIRVEQELIDLLRLDALLELPAAERTGAETVLALRAAGRTLGVRVDELLGKEEVVVKSLGAFLAGCGPYAGALISPEGRVILLLDPLRLAARRPAPAAPVGPVAAPSAAGVAARRVMLVDDSLSVRKVVGQMLERAGFEVATATDGAEALQRLGELRVDALVTDLEMPRLDGYQLIRDVRRRGATRDLPIAVLTTRAGDKHARLARDLGATHYLTKPVDEPTLVGLLTALLTPAAEAAGVR